jgi:hypothetical protein
MCRRCWAERIQYRTPMQLGLLERLENPMAAGKEMPACAIPA